ncbi:MAG: methyl-accepting chemotaxis protein [Paraglaciecola chathamensis]
MSLFGWLGSKSSKASQMRDQAILDAIDRSQAVIEFDLNGIIQAANDNFLTAMGYRADEVVGKHHSMFVDEAYKNSQEYRDFWAQLNRGQFTSDVYKRVAKGGKVVWIQASYNPLFDEEGKPNGVIKYATDITAQKIQSTDYAGQIDAISKSQAVIEFDMNGVILSANDNFLNAMGYNEQEVVGKHHSMFVEPEYKNSHEYHLFWEHLKAGEFNSGEFKRIDKLGNDVWIHASYNPIMDLNGQPFKVVKYASDITEQKKRNADYSGQIDALSKSQAVIEFDMKGVIQRANENFLETMGYTLEEVQGQHHSMFVEPEYKNSAAYREFWEKLNAGQFTSAEFKRLGKQGNEVWIQASYNPIMDVNGKPFKVVKYATDITAQKLHNADYSGQIDAIGKSQAVIEFDMNGVILSANDNFLNAMGYNEQEVVGKHHSMFVEPEYKNSHEYHLFWEHLKAGEFNSGEFKRIDKLGNDVWIHASYNPIMDLNGQPFKVVKYASDITEQKKRNADYSGQIDALSKSQAVIEFDMKGVIQRANENFLETMGYTLEEVQGQHHSMFVEPEYKNSAAYREFWEKLNAGQFTSAEFKRLGKQGNEVWIQASYNPIMDVNGKPFKVVKYATDITAQKLHNADYSGQIDAIGKSQAVIEFDMNGVILSANDNFLNAMGYNEQEVVGKHHSMFVESEYKNSHEYRAFWEQLNNGVFTSDEFKRIAKQGNEVWIQASYNPILDLNGKPFKVVKYATDITARKQAINEVKRVLNLLSDGDLTAKLNHQFSGEFHELGENVTRFIASLADTIGQINGSTETIRNASSEIAQGNSDLSNRTERQASSLEETASTMEELTGTVRLNAENANQANGLASQASTVASEGGDLINQVVATMSSINESARKISDIIGVIDGIAFQTNILALNAAVEAARAGEQGRGFAVVASEVRTLAQRSANAAKDIKELISDSVAKIENGNTLVNRSGETMDNVVTSIKRVNDLMAEIAAASAEQASGIDEVGKAINQMDEATQQNAALVEEATAAAESLQSQAEQLSERVAAFKFDENDLQVTPRLAPQPKAETKRPVQHKERIKLVQATTQEEDEWESF